MKFAACLLIFAIVFVSIDLPAQEDPAQQQVAQGAKERITAFAKTLNLNDSLVTEALTVIDQLVLSTRADQASIYSFVRTVNRNIGNIACINEDQSSRDAAECFNFQERVREITEELMVSSYTDALFDNDNLSNQIKIRLPLLIEDSLKLSSGNTEYAYQREDFLNELRTLSRRFLDTRRFRPGLGFAYSYLPRLSHTGVQLVDLSTFQTISEPSRHRDNLVADYSNISVPSLILSAKVPYVQLDVAIPSSETERADSTPVQSLTDPAREILFRSTITSKLSVNYDLTAKLSLTDFFQDDGRTARHDAGIGVGLTGFEIEDTGITDVRFRMNGSTTPFNDLPAGETINSVNKSSFNNPFLVAYYNVEISDQFQVGVEVRKYDSDTSSNSEVTVDDITLSINVIWYPTFTSER